MFPSTITYVILLISIPTVLSFCPRGCHCQRRPTSVNCEGARLKSIPIMLNPRIRSLNLKGNQITTVSLDELSIYKDLKFLDLSENQIKTISRGSFFRLINLQVLKLNSNLIHSLPIDSFTGLIDLKVLDLSDNAIQRIATTVFSDMRRLSLLNLSRNVISSVSPGAFTGLASLRELYLRNNELATIPSASFAALPSLVSLDLSVNLIPFVLDQSFVSLSSLESLSLEGNLLGFVEDNAFLGLDQLRSLDMANNHLHRVPSESFRAVPDLEWLSLGANHFSELSTSVLDGLAALNHLRIDHCPSLKSVNVNAFSGLFSLHTLWLSDNPALQHIHRFAFEKPTNLREIHLFGNNLTSLEGDLLDGSRLNVLDLRFNRWNCDCRLAWVPRVLQQILTRQGSRFEFYLTGATCATPSAMAGLSLVDFGRVLENSECESYTDQLSAIGALGALIGCLCFTTMTLYVLFYRKHKAPNNYCTNCYCGKNRNKEILPVAMENNSCITKNKSSFFAVQNLMPFSFDTSPCKKSTPCYYYTDGLGGEYRLEKGSIGAKSFDFSKNAPFFKLPIASSGYPGRMFRTSCVKTNEGGKCNHSFSDAPSNIVGGAKSCSNSGTPSSETECLIGSHLCGGNDGTTGLNRENSFRVVAHFPVPITEL